MRWNSVKMKRSCVHAKSLQLCPTLCNPMDCSLPWTTGYGQRTASSVHGILQERILEWVAVSSSRRSSGPRDQIYVSYISCIDRQVLYHQGHLESPVHDLKFGSLPTVVIFTDCLGLIPVSVFIFSKIIGPFFIFFTLFSFVK